MSELFGKLTNLSYEFFGVILPGVITSIFFLYVWAALGAMAPRISGEALPRFEFSKLLEIVDSITTERGIGVVILLILAWYFMGHIVLWISRTCERVCDPWPKSFSRVVRAIAFQFPRPKSSFDEKLTPLLNAVAKKFVLEDAQFEWRLFYPVVKNLIAQRVQYSLVATYQHKYTLHRSISCSAVLFFWLLFAIVLCADYGNPLFAPSWSLLFAGIAASLLFIWGFSGSFMYNWLMFGNTIITESYALLCGPRADVEVGKSGGN